MSCSPDTEKKLRRVLKRISKGEYRIRACRAERTSPRTLYSWLERACVRREPDLAWLRALALDSIKNPTPCSYCGTPLPLGFKEYRYYEAGCEWPIYLCSQPCMVAWVSDGEDIFKTRPS